MSDAIYACLKIGIYNYVSIKFKNFEKVQKFFYVLYIKYVSYILIIRFYKLI